ncbi:glycosyltransferase, partial [Bradyrhizobium elkanii]|uniref:glycosyltransferase n=1 Tax=Bradyrhizobium elkanii TaxID=29448 RepID=UPI00057136BB
MRDCEGGSVTSYNFLFASWGTLGNLSPLLTAARRLRRHGHHVRVIADPAMRTEVEAADFEFVTWRRAPKGRAADPTDVSDLRDRMRRVVFEPCSAYAADIRDEVGRVPTDAVLGLGLLFGAAVGAQACGVPFAFLSPHVSIRILPGMPPATSGLGQPKTPAERAKVRAASAALAAAMNASLPILNRARVDFGLPVLSDAMDLFDQADRVLLAISQAFDFEADALPGSFRYIGPLLDVPSWSRSWQAPWSTRPDCPRAVITADVEPVD